MSYTNTATFGSGAEDQYHYVEYVEGIYVGYRYYETAAADGFIDYDQVVQFPFGYGLSYTTFEESISRFEDDGTTGIMSSFNRIGATPAAECYPLLTTVLRNEWGFQGMVITDCVMSCATQDVNGSVRAGNDLILSLMENGKFTADTTDTAAGHQALRRASHNILYTIANSEALSRTSMDLYGWVKAIIAVDAVIWALLALYFVRWILKYSKWRKGEPLA